MAKLLLSVVCLVAIATNSSAQTMIISGAIRNLDGSPSDPVANFTVVARQGDAVVARGQLTSNSPPSYRVEIVQSRVNSADVRVLLQFRATGKDPTDIAGVPAVALASDRSSTVGNQTIDVVMPLAGSCPNEIQPWCSNVHWPRPYGIFSNRFRCR